MGVAVGDYNVDGRLDLLKTHFADDVPALYRNLGKGLFEDVATAAGLAVENRFIQWGTGFPDLDNDGRADLLYVTGSVYPEIERVLPAIPPGARAWCSAISGGGRFENVTAASGDAQVAHSSRGAAFGDIDNDGDLDVLVMNMNEPPSLLRNDLRSAATAGSSSRWRASARTAPRSAPSQSLTAGGTTQARTVLSQSSYYSHDDFRLHFGLGSSHTVDRIEITWPAGGTTVLTAVEADRVLAIKEPAR